MILQLPNGNSIEISVEQYLSMSDSELDYLNAQGYGECLEDPWFGSVLSKRAIEEEDEPILEDLTKVSIVEKLQDLDADLEENS